MNGKQKVLKAKGYSLWLIPAGETYNKLSILIKTLSEEYKSPLFEPHVTLLGEILLSEEDMIQRSKQLVFGQKSFSITLQTVDYEDYYFRALFMRAEKSESLLALHNRTKKIFEMQAIPYMPHLSLLYGNLTQSVKEQIIRNIGRKQDMKFTIGAIQLFKTDGEVSSWHKVKEFPLG